MPVIFETMIPLRGEERKLTFPIKCRCGGEYRFEQLYHRKKGTEQGVTAECLKCKDLYYAHNFTDLLDKIKRFQG